MERLMTSDEIQYVEGCEEDYCPDRKKCSTLQRAGFKDLCKQEEEEYPGRTINHDSDG
jgi:hypothetical protein